jgi:hypothetical protein
VAGARAIMRYTNRTSGKSIDGVSGGGVAPGGVPVTSGGTDVGGKKGWGSNSNVRGSLSGGIAAQGGGKYPAVGGVSSSGTGIGHSFLIIIDIFLYFCLSGWLKWKHMV